MHEVKMDLKQLSWEDEEWIHVAQDSERWWAFVNMVMNLQAVAPHSYICYLG
jgi:hypothetical protein